MRFKLNYGGGVGVEKNILNVTFPNGHNKQLICTFHFIYASIQTRGSNYKVKDHALSPVILELAIEVTAPV